MEVLASSPGSTGLGGDDLKTGEIFGIILNRSAQHRQVVNFSRAARCHSRHGRIANFLDHLDAAGRIVDRLDA